MQEVSYVQEDDALCSLLSQIEKIASKGILLIANFCSCSKKSSVLQIAGNL